MKKSTIDTKITVTGLNWLNDKIFYITDFFLYLSKTSRMFRQLSSPLGQNKCDLRASESRTYFQTVELRRQKNYLWFSKFQFSGRHWVKTLTNSVLTRAGPALSGLFLHSADREEIFIKTFLVLETSSEFLEAVDIKVVIKCQQQKRNLDCYFQPEDSTLHSSLIWGNIFVFEASPGHHYLK